MARLLNAFEPPSHKSSQTTEQQEVPAALLESDQPPEPQAAVMNDCLAFFTEQASNTKKVVLLRESGRCLDWESLSASIYSPGPVAGEELLMRIVINPIHLDEYGQLKPTAVDDARDKGCSVNRLAHISIEDSLAAAREREAARVAGGASRSVHGFSQVPANEVRNIRVGDLRAYGVFDTALEDNRAHADICQLVDGDKAIRRSARMQLFELLQSRTTVCS